jgi:hypothetical protein
MTEPAAFSAIYSDWKLIKTRGVVSISFEVPLEAAGHAHNVLHGMPSFAEDQWFAIARMKKPDAQNS